jgi:hypothetical protein
LKIIFLDIDGVLINDKSCRVRYDNPDLDCVARLNDLLERTQAKIVMSSCWRMGRTVQELQQLMNKWGVNGVVIAKTVWGPQGCQRGDEIEMFLRDWTGEPIESFIIVDDDADMGQYLPHLVHTRFGPGLTPVDVDMAVKLFEKFAQKHKDPAISQVSV